MLLMTEIMGCGRSKQNSPNSSKEDGLHYDGHINTSKEKPPRKKKHPGEKVNAEPVHAEVGCCHCVSVKKKNMGPDHAEMKPVHLEHSPKRVKGTHHDTAPQMTNGSDPHELHLSLDLPHFKDRQDPSSPTHEAKEFKVPKQNIRVTHSQIEFFKMLDEKIEKGRDYSSRNNSIIEFLDFQSP